MPPDVVEGRTGVPVIDQAVRTLAAAVAGGASNLTLCDTNGGSLPWQVGEADLLLVASEAPIRHDFERAARRLAEGLENAPAALQGLFTGKNKGKTILKVADPA